MGRSGTAEENIKYEYKMEKEENGTKRRTAEDEKDARVDEPAVMINP
jgi:hypothetical protein